MAWPFRKKASSQGNELDKMVLDQLRKAGSDLSQPHEVDNFLYFADQASAQQAADRLAPSSKTVQTSPAAQGQGWLTKAVVVVVPTTTNIAQMRIQMEAVAQASRGDYDGWGAPIVPTS
jgi:Regulator of ribonuclease activity B